MICSELYPSSIVCHLAQYLMHRHRSNLESTLTSLVEADDNREQSIVLNGFWSTQLLFHRFQWLSNMYAGTDHHNMIHWWQQFKSSIIQLLSQNRRKHMTSSIESPSQLEQSKHVSQKVWPKNIWAYNVEPNMYHHDVSYQSISSSKCRPYYPLLFSYPGFRRWLYWTLVAHSKNLTLVKSSTMIREMVNHLYIPHYFGNRYSRFLSSILVELTRLAPLYKSSNAANEPEAKLPRSLIDLICEYCLTVSQSEDQQSPTIDKVKEESSTEHRSLSPTVAAKVWLSNECMWFLNTLTQFPNDATQEMKANLLFVLETVFTSKCSTLSLLPQCATNSQSLTQLSITIKTLLIEKPFLMHSSFISIVIQWARTMKYGLPVMILFDLEKQMQLNEVTRYCEQCNARLKNWIRQTIQFQYPLKLLDVEPTPSSVVSTPDASEQQHGNNNNSNSSDDSSLESNYVWQSWTSFQQTTSSSHEKKKRRTNSQLAYLSPPQTKRYRNKFTSNSNTS